MLCCYGGVAARVTIEKSRTNAPSPRAIENCSDGAFVCGPQVKSSDARVCKFNCGALGGMKRARDTVERDADGREGGEARHVQWR